MGPGLPNLLNPIPKTVWSTQQALAWQEYFTETRHSFGGLMANCLLIHASLVPLNTMNGGSFSPLVFDVHE
jgi:hypothetical protein